MIARFGTQALEAPGPELVLFAAAGFLAALLFLLSLYAQVKSMAARGEAPWTLPLLLFLRVALVGGGIGAMVWFGPWAALAGLAGFLAGRVALAGPIARRFET
jgi:hypothetical protein